MLDLGIHITDFSMYLIRKSKPVSVFGNTFSKVGDRSNIKGKLLMPYGSAGTGGLIKLK